MNVMWDSENLPWTRHIFSPGGEGANHKPAFRSFDSPKYVYMVQVHKGLLHFLTDIFLLAAFAGGII